MRNKLGNNSVVIQQLQSQISEYQGALNETHGKYKKARKCLEEIAEKVCDREYAQGQLGGKNEMIRMNDIQLRDFIIANSLKQRKEFTKNILDMQNLYLQEQREKEEICRQLVEVRSQLNQLSVEHEKLKTQIALQPQQPVMPQPTLQPMPMYNQPTGGFPTYNTGPINSNTEPVNSQIPSGISPSISPPEEQKNEYQQSPISSDMTPPSYDGSQIVYYENQPFSMEEIMRKVDVYQEKLLLLLGDSGLNEQPEILNACMQSNEFGSQTVIRNNLKTMLQNKLLMEENIATPLRRKLTLYSLSQIGKEVYKSRRGKYPQKDEMTRIKEMHATLQHGYGIKDLASTLNGLGYTDICMDSTQNSVTIADGRRYVPDITAKSTNVMTYWEYELGHHHDNDMAEKLEKAAKVTKTVYIVVDKIDTKKKLQKQVMYFKKQMKIKKVSVDLIIYVGTLKELQDKQYLTLEGNRLDLREKKN